MVVVEEVDEEEDEDGAEEAVQELKVESMASAAASVMRIWIDSCFRMLLRLLRRRFWAERRARSLVSGWVVSSESAGMVVVVVAMCDFRRY